MNPNKLNTSLEFIKGIGKIRSKLIRDELKINTCQQMLYNFPFRYIDRSKFYNINEIPKNQSEVQIIGKIRSIRRTKVRYRDRLNLSLIHI